MLKRYGTGINLAVDNAHTRVLRLIGASQRVLELGCGVGHMTRVLVDRGCSVTAIELNPAAAEEARGTGAEILVADLDTFDWTGMLAGRRFDVVIAADVLEHLRDPEDVLKHARAVLDEDGRVVASIPNVAHVSVIAELLRGRFEYQPMGLLDNTHIHFFTRDAVYQCFEAAGFDIATLERITVAPDQTEFRTDLSPFPPEVSAFLESREEGDTYQFILSATPSAAGPSARRMAARRSLVETPSVGAALSKDNELDAVLQAIAARWMVVEDERTHHTALIGRLREQLLRAETHIGWLTGELQRVETDVGQLRSTADGQAGGHTTSLAEAQDEINRLKPSAQAIQSERAELAATIEQARRDADNARAEADRALADASVVREEAETIRRDAGRVRAECSRQAAEWQRASETLGRRLLDERFRMASEYEAERHERDTFAREAEALRQAVGVFEHSASWRVTAPLRSVSRFVRRLLRGGR